MNWAFLDDGGRLVEGGCVHALTGGTKAFTGVRGLFHMTDVYAPTAAGSTAFYQGEVILNAVKEEPVAQTASVDVRTTRAASTDGAPAGC